MVRVSESKQMQSTVSRSQRADFRIAKPIRDLREPRVSVIVPAFNEATRIAAVLQAISRSQYADEIIVVSDGSTDATAAVARQAGADKVVELPRNLGKGAAMMAGFQESHGGIVAFIDADLISLQPDQVDSLLAPIINGDADSTTGIFRGGAAWSDMAQVLAPTLSGQRAMRRILFETVPLLEDLRMGVEVSLSLHLHRCHARVVRVPLCGISHVPKEQKFGFIQGSKARADMYGDIARALWRLRRKELRRSGMNYYPARWEIDAR